MFQKGGGLKSAWQTANQQAGNSAKIWGGLFAFDKNKSFVGNLIRVVSRVTWELPQTVGGLGYSLLSNTVGQVERVGYYGGATAVTHNRNSFMMQTGLTLGSYINGNNTLRADPNNSLFQHEYGHYTQSQNFGLFYLSKVGIPSLFSKNTALSPHTSHPAEQDANIRAFQYFNNHVKDYTGWDRNENTINGYNWTLSYLNSRNQMTLKRGKLNLSWYDYLMGPTIFLPGLVNSLILNSKY